ncbi:MAG: hypothetical protein KKH75_07640 [Actinobacteria bacterium]|nr:hypothetical protein [Actinomycetota bacterium]
MQPMWEFLGQYWWMAFPLLGVAGAFGRRWELSARSRHQRRLEMIHAKAELKAAAAGGGRTPDSLAERVTGAVASGMGAATADSRQLERLFAAHDAVTARWLEYELDVAKTIAFPAMSDGRQPLTAAFLRAKRVADGLRPASAKARITREQLTEYRNAVTDYEVAFDVAERDARRLKDSSFTAVERKRLDTAKQLLSVAIDQAATPAERQLAYRRVREELDGLLSLSDGAIDVLELKVALEITDGEHPPTPEAAASGSAGIPAAGPSVTPPAAAPAAESWPVPTRNSSTAPGRVVHPKPRP